MKKFLSILLAVALLVGVMPLVMAEEIDNAEAPVLNAEAPAEAEEAPVLSAEAPEEIPEAPAEPEEAPAEPEEAPALNAAAPEEAPEAPASFAGTLSVFGPGKAEPGTTVLVKANVYEANMGYSIWWESYI